MQVLKVLIAEGVEDKIRFVDYAIGKFKGFETRNAVKKGIKRKRFLIKGQEASTGTWITNGDCIELLERTEKPKRYDKDIAIVYEDEHLAIVNKPAGLVVSGNQFNTLENCLVDALNIPNDDTFLKWGLPVHRLDAPTSGLVIFAKSYVARRALDVMLQEKKIMKTYHALVHGIPNEGVIKKEIEGKEAVSELTLVRSVRSIQNSHLSLVKLSPLTGRTHQLRIHCHSIGHSIVGDQKYLNEGGTFRHKGLFLSATHLTFMHPIDQGQVVVEIPVPEKFVSLLNREAKRVEKYD